MLLVTLSFVVFNGDGLSGALADLAGMFGLSGLPLCTAQTLYNLKSYAVLLIAAAVGATPLAKRLYEKIADTKLSALLEPACVAALLAACTAYLVDGSFNPFLYFRF
jgi:alginate O-acetyltransferase complex protein AlgI